MDREVKQRLGWVQLYEQTQDAGFVCRRCGISRPTLRKWWRRYQAQGVAGLASLSRRPHTSPQQHLQPQHIEWISELRLQRKLGVRCIQSELQRLYGLSFSLATLHKVLQRLQVKPLRPPLRRRHQKRYQKAVPGERVQVDTCKVGPGMVQYTAIDDCTRLMVVALYPRRTAENAVRLREQVVDHMLFPIQRIQTDRGTEFTSYTFQDAMAAHHIKWRPVKPRSPHLNGKVERAQQTALDEFYATLDLEQLGREQVARDLEDWQDYYNWHRVHGAIGQPPMYKALDLLDKAPDGEEIVAAYDATAEMRRNSWVLMDSVIPKSLKPSL